MTDVNAILEAALQYIQTGHKAALATVVETWGSAPRPVGAQLAIRGDGTFQGSVSGGCVEGAVVAEALEALQDGVPRLLEYGVSDDDVFAVGLACGGTIKVLVDPIGVGQGLALADLETLVAKRAARQAVGHCVNLTTWDRQIIGPSDAPGRFTSGKSGVDGDVFTTIHNPPMRLILVGGVHIAQSLVPMARLAGYEIFIIDPRESFASDTRFPGERLIHDWPDMALHDLGLDAGTALVTLSHDPKIDTPALKAGITSKAFYVGALGSTRTHGKRVAELQDMGFSERQIGRIHAPIGADIAAATPAEIAVSIMAEMTERLRRPETRP